MSKKMFALAIAVLATLFGGAGPAWAANGSQFISQDVPTTMVVGQVRTVSVTMKNTGTTAWTQGGEYKLGTQYPQDNTLWIGGTRVYLSATDWVAPGQEKTFTFNITAPGTPGTYYLQWRMVQDGVEWFGAYSTNVAIQVTSSPVDDAQFVSQNVPTTLNPGETRSVSITLRNSGSSTWTQASNLKLGSQSPQDNTLWGDGRVLLSSTDSIAPGQQKTFTFNITAPGTPGTYPFQWRMLREYVAWFGQSTPAVTINVVQNVTLCPGVQVTADGVTDSGPALQQCINNTPPGGTLELPAAAYGIATQVIINKPMTLRTRGTAGSSQSCEAIACATLKATPTFNVNGGGFLVVENTTDMTIDHIVLDGNRGARLGTTAASQCAAGQNRWGFNARMSNCRFCRFTWNVSKNALCGTALEFSGDDATISNNIVRGNGQNAQSGMWADGITIHYSDRATVTSNTLVDNSDVALILGGGRNAYVAYNSIHQPGQVTFAGLMLDNFNGATHGDFAGAVVTQNTVDCGTAYNCHFGINLGPHAWYLSANILGGSVYGNTVTNARQGINVDGAGTATSPLTLYGNTATGSPGSASFLCGTRSTSNLNINDSVVNRNGDTTPATNWTWHGCP
ncbi:NBR1-Ig-like domain-containing protein [Archangium gephyra]|uniref:NBR1-Ig-like domain-containing protein n=1 Tax=Archangium gephyra TaxID=48 RepID=UPI0035D49CAD